MSLRTRCARHSGSTITIGDSVTLEAAPGSPELRLTTPDGFGRSPRYRPEASFWRPAWHSRSAPSAMVATPPHFSAAHPITDEKAMSPDTPRSSTSRTPRVTAQCLMSGVMRWTISCAKLSTGSITDGRRVPYIRELVHYLRIRFPQSKEAIQQRAGDFLRRGSYYEGMKSSGWPVRC